MSSKFAEKREANRNKLLSVVAGVALIIWLLSLPGVASAVLVASAAAAGAIALSIVAKSYYRHKRDPSVPLPLALISETGGFFTGLVSLVVRGRPAPRLPPAGPRPILPPESPYELLGVDPSASDREVKEAWRRAALRTHPDRNKSPGAQRAFERLREAYEAIAGKGGRR